MAKYQIDAMLDAALNYIKTNTRKMSVCTTMPTTYTQATSTYKLAMKSSMSSTDFTGPADGTTSGRKVTINAQAAVTVDTGGTALFVALCSDDTLLYVTTCTSMVLVQAETVDIPAWNIEIGDAT